MPDAITITINGASIEVPPATTVAAAIALAAAPFGTTRRSVSRTLRAPLCGMGVCQECRVTIDGRAHVLACQTLCRSGMRIESAS